MVCNTITKDEEDIALCEKYQSQNDELSLKKLMDKYKDNVKNCAINIFNQSYKIKNYTELDDLITFGNFGLYEAIISFNKNKKTKFKTYALFLIKCRIRDELRKNKIIIRKSEKMEESQYNFKNNVLNPNSLDSFFPKNECFENSDDLIDFISFAENINSTDFEQKVIDQLALKEILTILENSKFKPNQIKAYKLSVINGWGQNKIAELMGLTTARVNQIITEISIWMKQFRDEFIHD